MAIIFILIGNWVINWLRGGKKNANFTIFNPLMIILMFVFAVGYELYWAHRTFAMLGSFVPGVIQDVKTGELFLTLSMLFSANFSQAVPLWASFVRMFWLVAIYIFGALLTLGKLIWHRSLQVIEIKEIGSILGIGVMASVAMLLAPQGNQFHRFIMYGSIVITPLILRFVFGYLGKWSTTVLGFFVAICLLLVFPTFLVYNGSIVTTAFYPNEVATGEFLEMAFDKGNSVTTFSASMESGPKLSYYYTPDTLIQAPPLYTASKDEFGLWQQIDGLTNKFIDWETKKDYGLASYRDYAIFISSDLMKLPFKHLFGVSADDSHWILMEEKLVTNTLRVYDNGNIRVYVAP